MLAAIRRLRMLARHTRPARPPSPARSQSTHSIQDLQEAFRNPDSPFYIAPGEIGPASDEPNAAAAAEEPEPAYPPGEIARAYALKQGYDASSFWEQTIAWGDLDSFRHLNNVRYMRFFESGRMKFTQSLGEEVGGLKQARDMMEARGVSIILKSMEIKFKRPVTYPDTLLIAHKPHSIGPTHFTLSCLAYSFAQQTTVATAESVCVWYDYDVWKKAEPPADLAEALARRAR